MQYLRPVVQPVLQVLMPWAGGVCVPPLSLLLKIFATPVALTAKRICTNLIDPACIAPLLACRLIALNKNPGVRPIGVG